MGLFDIGIYGVPIAIAGTAYILLTSPFLLPGGSNSDDGAQIGGNANVLLGARLTPWSAASGRTVKRSGLRDTGGIYLVSVYRHETGRVHRAVGQDFGLNVGDILYFASGFPETFAEFCNEHGLEVVTNEVEDDMDVCNTCVNTAPLIPTDNSEENTNAESTSTIEDSSIPFSVTFSSGNGERQLSTIKEMEESMLKVDFDSIGTTKESLVQSDFAMKMRSINQLTDIIRGNEKAKTSANRSRLIRQGSIVENLGEYDASKVIVATDKHHLTDQQLIIIGVNTHDRSGLLHDISKGIVRLKLQCRSTEAAVVHSRSISIWRCELLEGGSDDVEEIWSVLNALLENVTGIQAIKQRGLVVVRAVVQKNSRLIGKTALESQFSNKYKAAIVAIRRGDKAPDGQMSKVKFAAGDTLILQTKDDSPLLVKPEASFYQNEDGDGPKRGNSFSSLRRLMRSSFGSQSDLEMLEKAAQSTSPSNKSSRDKSRNNSMDLSSNEGTDIETGIVDQGEDFKIGMTDEQDAQQSLNGSISESSSLGFEEPQEKFEPTESQIAVWRDLRVAFPESDEYGETITKPDKREFLTAMQIKKRSQLANKTAIQSGLDKLSGVYLVSIERRVEVEVADADTQDIADSMSVSTGSVVSAKTNENVDKLISVAPDEVLLPGDILWFSGPANKIGDLRKIPGLSLYENDEVKKVNSEIQDRRLVQAVVARQSPLVGKTVVDVKFRTRYGAAVIAVHREGKRVHEHPGKVKLHAGDVLLLEAGPTFVVRNADTDRSFALLSEVENSAPPRLRLLLPALSITLAMLAVFTAGVTSLLVCALIASMLMVMLGILSQQEVRDAINWDVYLTIASAFGIGTALTNSGIAGSLAVYIVSLGEAVGKFSFQSVIQIKITFP